ncbi:YciI family protein [Terrabacter terrigena]|uniref:YciI family protein n=1 Tax=Terrabacter terrigena TaxID=574718 RepID=A0ABW3MYI0_9MICO
MRYLMIHKIDEARPEAWNPSQEFQDAMGALMSEYAESGVLLAAEGVTQTKDGALVRKTEGAGVSVTDGPFSEAREVIGGFALVNVASKEEAVQLASKFASLFDEVSVEVRRVYEFEDLPQG